jgi:hypothetical protein
VEPSGDQSGRARIAARHSLLQQNLRHHRLAPQSGRRKFEIINERLKPGIGKKWGCELRHDIMRPLSDPELQDHIIYFQIANASGRRACSVRLKAANKNDANFHFRNRWPQIESMARHCLVEGLNEDGEIRILLPPSAIVPATFSAARFLPEGTPAA